MKCETHLTPVHQPLDGLHFAGLWAEAPEGSGLLLAVLLRLVEKHSERVVEQKPYWQHEQPLQEGEGEKEGHWRKRFSAFHPCALRAAAAVGVECLAQVPHHGDDKGGKERRLSPCFRLCEMKCKRAKEGRTKWRRGDSGGTMEGGRRVGLDQKEERKRGKD